MLPDTVPVLQLEIFPALPADGDPPPAAADVEVLVLMLPDELLQILLSPIRLF